MTRPPRTSPEALARAEREGREARAAGKDQAANPYGLNTLWFSPALRKAWRLGWEKGKAPEAA